MGAIPPSQRIMTSYLTIAVCQNFEKELIAALSQESAEDVDYFIMPARCGRPTLTWADIEPDVTSREQNTFFKLYGCNCLTHLEVPPAYRERFSVERFQHWWDQAFVAYALYGLFDRLVCVYSFLFSSSVC